MTAWERILTLMPDPHPMQELFEAIEAYIDEMDPGAEYVATNTLHVAMSKVVPTDAWARSPWEPNYGTDTPPDDIRSPKR